MQIVSRLYSTLEVELPLRFFFEGPTVSKLAAEILRNSADRAKVERVAQLVLQLERLSDDEIQAMLQAKSSSKGDTLK